MGCFCSLLPKTSKRALPIEEVSTAWLVKNRDILCSCVIFVYGSAVASALIYKEVRDRLITPRDTDRAGAERTAALDVLIQSLKEVHRQNYNTQEITWRLWANYIQAEPMHARESLISSPPPSSLAHLF